MLTKTLVYGKLHKLERASLQCSCGEKHTLNTSQLAVLNNAAGGAAFYINQYGKSAHLIIERGIEIICNKDIVERIPKRLKNGASVINGCSIEESEAVCVNISENTTVLVAIGGSAACQSGKYLSAKLGLPLILILVLPDDDDMLSGRSMLTEKNVKKQFDGRAPEVVFVSLDSAFKFSGTDTYAAAALIAGNLLLYFESKFNNVSKNTFNCDVLNSLLVEAVKDCLSIFKKGLNKTALEQIFTSLIRISVAKAMNSTGVYDTSFAAVCNYIESETGAGKGKIAGTVFSAMVDFCELVIKNYDLLTVPELSAEQPSVKYGYGLIDRKKERKKCSLDGIGINKENMLKELEVISKIRALIKSLDIFEESVTKEILEKAVKDAPGIYGFEGVITYGRENGLLG